VSEAEVDPRVDALLASAHRVWDDDGGGVMAALELLLQAVAIDPDVADVRHALGLAYEELGDQQQMVRHFLQTRLLDARDDRAVGVGASHELDLIVEVARAALERLPAVWRDRLEGLTILLEPRPPLALVREGFDPRAFGLFEGPSLLDGDDVVALPPRIVLFSSNLLAHFGAGGEELTRQVEITVLHEVAHYFGYEEDEMDALGLE
jgi:predicted Zn-dependent protease with MMP-like domain